ncbi:MAG: hypothetical protein IT236_16760 [Bacteroidia bacterium]|nr:hypothetical protein [Bacteroidia bacterium]
MRKTWLNIQFLFTIAGLLVAVSASSQANKNYRAVFVHAEYQWLNYNFMNIGIGFQQKKHLVELSRHHAKFSFGGYTVNYSKKIQNSDWGLSLQSCIYSATANGPFAVGFEVNYKSIQNKAHFGAKPFIGLSFPIVSLVYAHNFDFYDVKAERLNQHELILSARIPVFRLNK